MAEAYEKFTQYEYHKSSTLDLKQVRSLPFEEDDGVNSNLVIRPGGSGPTASEPTGEPESLSNRIKYKMGDKVIYEKPKELKELARPKREGPLEGESLKKRAKLDIAKGATVLDIDVTENFTYKPTTQVTSFVYEQLLNALQMHLGDQPEEVVKGAADEIMAALKADNIKDIERRRNCEEVLGKMDDILFTKLYQLSKQISDYNQGLKDQFDTDVRRGDLDDATGVGVVFDEDDQDLEDLEYAEMNEENEDEDDDELKDENKEHRHLAAKHFEEDEDLAEERDAYFLDIAKIDPHWLQRMLLNIRGDSTMAVATEKEILSILPTADIQECENKLVFILKYDNFDFAKLVLRNRWKIFYCTRLGQSQTAEEKKTIYDEMKNSEEGLVVLEQLETVKLRVNKEKELTRNVRKEAATLAAKAQQSERGIRDEDTDEYTIGMGGETAVIAEEVKKPSRFIDLENLQFTEGGHLMSNARVRLPEGSQRIEKKSYDEVIVQPYKKPKEILEERKPISELPQWAQAAFTEIKLNPIQTEVYPIAFEQYTENMLVCAPTGAGKTNVALLAILNTIHHYRSPTGSIDLNNFKIIYICKEKCL
ncbi:putative activating signal cointegrator 1 complex subunit 3 [Cardiosporidium cionae]|uniref:Activating signal cointegrator 1 complex subunit 3 n=1 Tax=Cardiosporidium cionae TaxID=476202 RepID=A0ABQ7J8N4_9APIC|nr:putative activating signal cointegrator 1 complex subunit 3 [Cardiosporidium cionae]|eukprot:KAF8820355.1 putative activating signal cointegrator 1 complex subunit 3 [Cardiosporidium cionae]